MSMVHEFTGFDSCEGTDHWVSQCKCGWREETRYWENHGLAMTAYLRLHSDHIPLREHYEEATA